MAVKVAQLNFDEFLKELKEKPTVSLLTDVINNVIKSKVSSNVEVEILAMQILLAVKLGDDKTLEKRGLDAKVLKSKLSRTVTKTFIDTVLQAISILEKLKTTPKEYLKVLQMLEDGFKMVLEGKVEEKKEESVKEYKNEHMKEVLTQFESNQSFVYLLSLVNRAYAEELPIGRVNRILASLEILASIKESGENKNIEFGAMTLDELRFAMKGSMSLEVATMCYQAAQALNERISEVSEATPSLINKIKEINKRFEHIVKKIRES